MGKKGSWLFSAVKRVFMIPRCCKGDHDQSFSRSNSHSAYVAEEVVQLIKSLTITSPPTTPRRAVRMLPGRAMAATKIQAALRGYLARREFRAVRSLLRLKRLLDGNAAKSQTTQAVHCMETMVRVQSQIRSRRIRMAEENQALQRQLLRKCHKEIEEIKTGEEWNDSPRSKEQIAANLMKKKEAAMRRERTLAYAFSNQWKSSSRSLVPIYTDFKNPQWGWSWMERWMAASPLEHNNTKEINDNSSVTSASRSTIEQTTNGLDSRTECNQSMRTQKSSQPPSHQSPPRSKPASPTATAKKQVSSRVGQSNASDSSKSKQNVLQSSPRLDSERAKSPAAPRHLAYTSAKVVSRFHNQQDNKAGTIEKGPISPVKKTRSLPVADKKIVPSPAKTKSILSPKPAVSTVKGSSPRKNKRQAME
ncbi:protein IQ-DOMAIN 1-like [Canna indica]|uniref:Protein IQ-DOMAIN 1-like n=1 Tax=Canna indica TaxID=4628 RepID=A0AAQ3KDB5_9LILI|nr:protein IQ-DOMAIN 1-like [Canna indica]